METPQLQMEETVAEKRLRTERSESEIDTRDAGAASTIQMQERSYDKHLFNRLSFRGCSRFVKDHEELYDKTN